MKTDAISLSENCQLTDAETENIFITRKKRSHCVLGERCITVVFKYSACHFEQHKVRMNRPIYFRGGNSFLSNLYVCSIHAWGHTFNTVEAAYMWKKCIFYGDTETAKRMLATRTGLQAKYLSKTIRDKVHLRAHWIKQRRAVMYALVSIFATHDYANCC